VASRTRHGMAGAACAVLCAPVAWAQAGPESVRVAVSAPQGCVDPQTFLANIRTRTSRARLAADNERARSFGVYISRNDSRANGTLVITDIDGRSSSRQIEGATCQEVASALALIAALAIDPEAQPGSVLPPPIVSAPEPSPTPPAVPRRECPTCPAPPPPLAAVPAAQPLHTGITGGLGLSGAFAPGVSLESLVAVEVLRDSTGLSISLGLARSTDRTLTRDDKEASLRRTSARLGVCPFAIRLHPSVGLRSCALMEAGAVSLHESASGYGATQNPAWFALGLLAGARWQIASGFDLQGHVGALTPLTRDKYQWRDGVTAHSVPWVGFVGSFEFVLRIL
jgi:hypothetical protein